VFREKIEKLIKEIFLDDLLRTSEVVDLLIKAKDNSEEELRDEGNVVSVCFLIERRLLIKERVFLELMSELLLRKRGKGSSNDSVL